MYKSDSRASGRTKKGSAKKKGPSHRDPGLLWIVTPSEGVLLGCLSTFVGYVSSGVSAIHCR
jgi:hypothetical protein